MYTLRSARAPLALLIAAALLAAPQGASAAQFLFGSGADGQSITRDSVTNGGAAPVNREIADDFTATGELQRLLIDGYDCFNCAGALASGVIVRLYEKDAGGAPGGLLHEFPLAADDVRFIHDPNRTGHEGTLDISFPQGFAVDGSYFISVQLEYPGAGSWPLWSANTNAPHGSAYYMRDHLAGGAWVHGTHVLGGIANNDVSFALYGVRPGPPPPRLVAECGEWKVESAPLPAGAENAQLRAIKTFGPDEMWAVGDYTRTVSGSTNSFSLAMHFVNDAWTIVPTPSPTACPSCTQIFVSAIEGAAPDDIWAAGWKRIQNQEGFLGGQVFVMHYDGTSWQDVASPISSGGNGSWIRGIQVLAPDDIWFVGDWVGATPWNGPSNTALAMHWNGSAFTLQETPFPGFGTPGWSLEAVTGALDDLWAVGGGSDGDHASDTYFMHWNGSQWQLSQPDLPGDTKRFSHMLSLTPQQVFAGGEGFTVAAGYFGIVAGYNGAAWTTATTTGGGGPMLSFGPDSVLALGSTHVYWNGATWEAQPRVPDVIGASLSDIEQNGPCNASAVGSQQLAGVRRPLIVNIKPIVFHSSFE